MQSTGKLRQLLSYREHSEIALFQIITFDYNCLLKDFYQH